jgi:hypothetical protein
MTLTEVKDLRRLINPMVKIETAVRNRIPLDDVIQGADAVTELGLRVAGAEIGKVASASVGGGGNSLIAAQAGSKAVRQIFDNLPNATVRQILENAVKDPEAMAILLDKGRTQKQQIDIANRLLNYLGSMGVSVGKTAITPALNYVAVEEPRPAQLQGGVNAPFTPEGQAARQLRNLPKAPNTRGVPGLTDNAPKPPGQGGGSGAPTNANARSMFQSLFPFDSVSPMIGGPSQQPPK